MKLHYYYDREADVLYFSQGKPSAKFISVETPDDVVLRLNPKTHAVTGFTVLNFSKRLKHHTAAVALPLEMRLTALR